MSMLNAKLPDSVTIEDGYVTFEVPESEEEAFRQYKYCDIVYTIVNIAAEYDDDLILSILNGNYARTIRVRGELLGVPLI